VILKFGFLLNLIHFLFRNKSLLMEIFQFVCVFNFFQISQIRKSQQFSETLSKAVRFERTIWIFNSYKLSGFEFPLSFDDVIDSPVKSIIYFINWKRRIGIYFNWNFYSPVFIGPMVFSDKIGAHSSFSTIEDV